MTTNSQLATVQHKFTAELKIYVLLRYYQLFSQSSTQFEATDAVISVELYEPSLTSSDCVLCMFLTLYKM